MSAEAIFKTAAMRRRSLHHHRRDVTTVDRLRVIADGADQSADPAPVERRSSKQRSRMTNGTALLPAIDGRSAIARRFKDIASGILADQGGADQCSELRLQLARRFAAAAVLAEQLESRLANGEQIDIQEHALLCSTLARLASRIGIERRARDVTTLADYLQQRQGTAE